MKAAQRCQTIELILSDVDGVLTDGGVTFDNQGIEIKTFHIRDGLGIKLWRKAGGKFALVTGRSSHIVALRAGELGIDAVRQGVDDKRKAVLELIAQFRLQPSQAAYIGDDLPDLPALRSVGLAVAPADAVAEVRAEVHHVTQAKGGGGAVRELIEFVLQSQKRWEEVVRSFGNETRG